MTPLPEGPRRPPVSGISACKCGACPIDADYWPEAPTEAARQCAWGAEGGGWCCDCTDWDAEDGQAAFEFLWEKEVKRRDILRAGLLHIAEHADLDHAERGIAEAARYAIVARDSVRKAGLYA